jgi:hypothetical protein
MGKPFRLMPTETTEAQVLDAVLRYLAVEPRVTWGPFRCNIGQIKAPRSPEAWAGWSITGADRKPSLGFPDVICAVSGTLLCLEAKRASTRLSGGQEAFRDMCEAGGTIYAVVRSVDDAQAVVKGLC